MAKIAFVVPSCAHYRVKTYELLNERLPELKLYFFSQGNEWYQMQELGARFGHFKYEDLGSFKIGSWYFTPSLFWKLWRQDVYISSINGRISLPFVYLMARLRRKPFVLWTGIWHRVDTPFHRLFYPFLKHIYRNANAIVTYGTHIQQFLIGEGVAAERIFPAKHAVDNDLYSRPVDSETISALRQRLNIPPEHTIILYVGRLVPEKGLDYLLAAFEALAEDSVSLVVVGTGIHADHLKAQVAKLGIAEHLHFVGFVSPQELTPYYAMADIFVLPSVSTPQFKEPWGLVINEAFNQGLPAIATEVVGAAAGGLVQHGVNGYIVPERDSGALNHHLALLVSDPEMRAKFGQHAAETVVQWNNAAMVDAFVQAIEFAQQ